MDIAALGYIGVNAANPDDWREFATRLLGMQVIDRGGGGFAFRMDDRQQRLVVTRSEDDNPAYLGWEARDKAALQRLGGRMSDAGIDVHVADQALCDARLVGEMIWANDPGGNRIEIFVDPAITDDPFTPGRPISGFATGPYGMGHAVLNVADATALMPFYRDTLGFAVSDFGLKPVPIYFFHCNARHHSFAMIGTGQRGLHHFMVEYDALDDVGQGYDLAQLDAGRIAYTLGRHTNDYMTSFYSHTPSGFFIESGFGGRLIDMATWQAEETFCGPSFWGHDRPYLPDHLQREYRDMRLDLARQGARAPNCPWLEATLQSQG